MAFFKFRKAGAETAPTPAQVPSVESIRQRAKYRLAGASVLVLVGVIGLPMLFDKQPRPIAVDMPIDIPDKGKVSPLVVPPLPVSQPVTPVSSASVVNAPVVDMAASSTVAAVSALTEPKPKVAQAQAEKVQDATKNVVVDAAKAVSPAASAAASKPAQISSKPAAPADVRYVVQVGAFADNVRAHEVRVKLERAGLKTYAQVAQTADGKRIRVRTGPFTNKAEADKAAEKIKKLNLPAALLTL
jgi:DedD protein